MATQCFIIITDLLSDYFHCEGLLTSVHSTEISLLATIVVTVVVGSQTPAETASQKCNEHLHSDQQVACVGCTL